MTKKNLGPAIGAIVALCLTMLAMQAVARSSPQPAAPLASPPAPVVSDGGPAVQAMEMPDGQAPQATSAPAEVPTIPGVGGDY